MTIHCIPKPCGHSMFTDCGCITAAGGQLSTTTDATIWPPKRPGPMVVKAAGKTLFEIHFADESGEYVIADEAGWLPGTYPTIRDAVQGWLEQTGDEQAMRGSVSHTWSKDWNSPEDQVYDTH